MWDNFKIKRCVFRLLIVILEIFRNGQSVLKQSKVETLNFKKFDIIKNGSQDKLIS